MTPFDTKQRPSHLRQLRDAGVFAPISCAPSPPPTPWRWLGLWLGQRKTLCEAFGLVLCMHIETPGAGAEPIPTDPVSLTAERNDPGAEGQCALAQRA
jgi:hypothetical protein